VTIRPRPDLQVVTRYTSYVRIWIGHTLTTTVCVHVSLPVAYNQQKRPGDLDVLTLKVMSESRVTWATCVNFSFRPRVRSDVRHRQTSDRRRTL